MHLLAVIQANFRYPAHSWKLFRALGVGNEKKLARCCKEIDKFVYGLIRERKLKEEEDVSSWLCHLHMISKLASGKETQGGGPRQRREGGQARRRHCHAVRGERDQEGRTDVGEAAARLDYVLLHRRTVSIALF